MITPLTDIPENVIGFQAWGEVSADDLKNVLIPAVDTHMKMHDRLNYILELNTDVSNFTAGAWVQDMLLGLKHIAKWNRSAIITDDESVANFTGLFSKIVPGEFKGFKKSECAAAIEWASGNS